MKPETFYLVGLTDSTGTRVRVTTTKAVAESVALRMKSLYRVDISPVSLGASRDQRAAILQALINREEIPHQPKPKTQDPLK